MYLSFKGKGDFSLDAVMKIRMYAVNKNTLMYRHSLLHTDCCLVPDSSYTYYYDYKQIFAHDGHMTQWPDCMVNLPFDWLLKREGSTYGCVT